MPQVPGQLRQVARDDLPHDLLIDGQIVMHDLVAHPDDVAPWNLRVRCGVRRTDLAGGFSDDLNQSCQREAEVLIRIEVGPCQAPNLLDRLQRHVEHVPDVHSITRRHRVTEPML